MFGMAVAVVLAEKKTRQLGRSDDKAFGKTPAKNDIAARRGDEGVKTV